MRPVPRRLVVALLVSLSLSGLLGACGGHSPTEPGGSAGASLRLSVGPAPSTSPLTVGMTSYSGAWLVRADNTSVDCTATASWRSSDPSVATIAPGGVLHAVGAGVATITATCEGVSASAGVTVYEAAALAGIVRDEAGSPLQGANVWVQDSKYGRAATTDGSGRYRIDFIRRGGNYPVSARKDGYETVSQTMTLAAPETVQDFTLTVGLSVTGKVTELGLGALAEATVEVTSGVNAGQSDTTTSWGAYALLHLKPGRFTLRARKAGYESVERTLDTAISTNVDFELKSAYGTCLVSVNPLAIDGFPSAGGSATIDVNAAAGRTWSASVNQPWIAASGGSAGPGQVLLRIQPSVPGATDVREAIVRVGCGPNEGQNVRVSQYPDCRVALAWAADSPTSFTAAGGTGHVTVKTGVPSCYWEAVSRSDWIRTVGVRQWRGDLDSYFVVDPNPTGAARTGSLVIGEQVWEVRQAAQ